MLSKQDRLGYRTWIEIDREAIANNFAEFRKLIPQPTKLMSVVKSNAYGHGLVSFSQEMEKLGIDWFAVDSIVEGLRIRKEGITKPILVLGYTLPERLQEAIDNNISVTASSMYMLESLLELKLSGKIKVHVKIDSGMHRQGFLIHEQEKVIEFLKSHTDVTEVEGLYTHFAAAKDPAHPEETNKQIVVFKDWKEKFSSAGFTPIVHAAATGAAMLFPDSYFDMVRIGIGFHGIFPSSESKSFLEKKINLQPTFSWKTIISEFKTIPKGERIGYDFTEETTRETVMAVCPIGYWHGFPRSLSSVGELLVHGKRCKVLGRVSMDMIVIDITDVPDVKVGDEAVIIGESEADRISADDVAKKAQNSTYELITRINPLIKKFYT